MNTTNWWEKYKVNVPEGTSGAWRVEKFTVDEEGAAFHNMRAMFRPGTGTVHPGIYTRLMRGGTLVMSDTPSEIRDHIQVISKATGHVLIAGLGIGMVARACLVKPEVTKVTVVELSPDVIALVGTGLKAEFGDKLEIVEADIMLWKPPTAMTYDVAWFDIWDDICTDNLGSMQTLNRRYGRRTGWKGCWQERFLKYQKRRDKRSGW